MTLREAAQQALEALTIPPEGRDLNQQALACYRAEAILRAALAKPECKRRNPCEADASGYCARCHSEAYP